MPITVFLSSYDDVLLPEDVQKILHVGRNTVYKYLAEGSIHPLYPNWRKVSDSKDVSGRIYVS